MEKLFYLITFIFLITKIQAQVCCDCQNKIMRCEGNRLTTIPVCPSCSDIVEIYFVENMMTELLVPKLYNKIKRLNVAKNQIRNLYPFSIYNFPNLETLNLSYNPVEQFFNLNKGRFRSLQALYMRNCIDLDTDILKPMSNAFPNLKILSLRRNKLKRISSSVLPRSLSLLDLSYNDFTSLKNDDLDLTRLKNLDSLDLSGVTLVEDWSPFLFPITLKKLSLRNVHPKEIDLIGFSDRLTHIWLDLQPNLFECNCEFVRNYIEIVDANLLDFQYGYKGNCFGCRITTNNQSVHVFNDELFQKSNFPILKETYDNEVACALRDETLPVDRGPPESSDDFCNIPLV